MSNPNEAKTLISKRRLAQILGILKKHHITKGVDPVKFREILEDLGPTFVKIGQIMASRQDMFSERYCKELVKLRDNVAPLPFADVQRVIEEEYGCPMQEVFSSFERIPLGSASIAQVHKASLLDGREIVVKVQRPYIYEMMERDISLIRRAGKLLRLSEVLGSVIDINIVMDEFWFTAKQEMDFLNEARFAMEFARNHQSITYIGAPLIEQAYTTSRVLVMEYIDGIVIDDRKTLEEGGYDLREIASKLAENSEIIAMFSTGMSFKRMMRPYMISAAIIALTTFTLSSYVIPKGSVTRLNFEDRYIKPKKQNSVSNVQLEVDSGVIAYIDNYNNAMKTGNRFSLDKFVDKKLVSHLTARRITYDTATVHKWTIHDYMVRELDGLKEKITKGDRIDSIINMEPSDFLIMKNQQEMLTSPELSDYIEKQKRRGFANIKEFEIEYHKRIAMSFASFILTIIGVSLSSRKTKGGMGLHLGIGLGLSFSYILFQTITSTFAVNGNVPPAIAVWIPNILYAGIAFFLYQKAPK